MRRRKYLVPLTALLAFTAVFALAACDTGGGKSTRSYLVAVTNVSANQPLSPPALISHNGTYTAWKVGTAAGDGLEQLAEGGNPAALLAEAGSNPDVWTTASGNGILLPGQTAEFSLEMIPAGFQGITVATMLVNTNDAFTGMTGLDLSGLLVGETVVLWPPAMDAGTEGNTESAGSVPGPAAGGEGYNADRSGDRDFVAVHPGVVTADDGLATSALDESHRFSGPVMLVRVLREK